MPRLGVRRWSRTIKAKWLEKVPYSAPTNEAAFDRRRQINLLYRIRTGRVKNPSLAASIAYGIIASEDINPKVALDNWTRPCVPEPEEQAQGSRKDFPNHQPTSRPQPLTEPRRRVAAGAS